MGTPCSCLLTLLPHVRRCVRVLALLLPCLAKVDFHEKAFVKPFKFVCEREKCRDDLKAWGLG